MKSPLLTLSGQRKAGFALVLTLAMVVLITFAVVAYFSRATTNRRIESASGSAVRADILARTASEMILSDLRSEINGGSSISQPSSSQMPIYTPTDPQKMVPSRVLSQGTMLTDPTFNNLTKQSSGRFFPSSGYTTNPLITATTGHDTSISSTNNRNVSIARWNYPVLNTGAGFATSSQLPQWILLDRTGVASSQTLGPGFNDYTLGNDSAIIGRFAFNVYDVGGLLDSSVAGNPIYSSSPLTDPQIQQLKSTEAGAMLNGILPGFDAAKQTMFVNTLRYKNDTSTANFLLHFMSTNTGGTFADSGFMRPTSATTSGSNSMAFSRQDLIRATIASNAYIPVSSLPYFTHFVRELNAPSWSPTQDSSTMGGNTLYPYFTNRDSASAINRNIPNVRVQTAFTRPDGTTAVVGEPLIKTRFPLRRLDGVAYNGVNTAGFYVLSGGGLQAPSGTTVQRDFGLIWDSTNTRWNYVGASGSTTQTSIATLDQVSAAGREPNFFEILKAFILSGSIGLGSDNSGATRTFVTPETKYYQPLLSSDSQIIQIGANTIDQWDGDKNPTFIYFAGNEIAGIETIPYLNKIGFQCRWSTAATPVFSAFIVPSFWTPAQNATAVGTQNTTTIPAVRFVMTSGTVTGVVESSTASATSSTVTGSSTSPSVNLTQTATFGPSPDAASSATTVKSGMSGTANSKLGITLTFGSMGGVTKTNTVRAYPKMDKAVFEMQVQIGGTSAPWKTYQRWFESTVNVTSTTVSCEPAAGFDWTNSSIYDPEFVVLDPRTMRFGAWRTDGKTSGNTNDFTRGVGDTLDRASPDLFQAITGLGPQGTSFTGVGAQMANNTAASPGYLDLDGIRRRGDYLTSVTTTSALLPTNSADRPPGLGASTAVSGRQIRTVAELGAVFRDQPWKTLNFTTADSGDAGLLDAFSIFEPNSVFRSDITAGKISLNTRQPLVFSAVLSGASTNTSAATLTLMSSAQRDAVANALVAMTAGQPMINKSELVTRFAADPSVTALGNKEAREAVIRALSDVGETRTWNFMIDVIAQSGRYGAAAANVDQFIVEGEKRYWLHVAIDRFTGEVIDQQLEKINE